MENILQFEKEVLRNYEIVCKIMSDKKYSQQNLLSLMRAIMRGGGEREVAKSKILNILDSHTKVLDTKNTISEVVLQADSQKNETNLKESEMNQTVINQYISQVSDDIMRIENAPLDIPKESIYNKLVFPQIRSVSEGGSDDSDVMMEFEDTKGFSPRLYEMD
jgi:hypothetical protein